MLTCVYHPIELMRVVEEDEAERLKALGTWFDSPKKAEDYRLKVEQEIRDEDCQEKTISKSTSKTSKKGKNT